jgi:hypothetical protein
MSAVLLATAKQFLQISHSSQDTVVQLLIDGAEAWMAQWLGVAFASASHTEDLDGGELWLWPNYRPVTAVDSVKDNRGNDAELDAILIGQGRIGRADADGNALDAAIWPDGVKRWHAKYTAGWATLPTPVQLAVLQLVYRSYYRRGGQAGDGAAGASFNWGTMADAEVLRPLYQYRLVSSVRC